MYKNRGIYSFIYVHSIDFKHILSYKKDSLWDEKRFSDEMLYFLLGRSAQFCKLPNSKLYEVTIGQFIPDIYQKLHLIRDCSSCDCIIISHFNNFNFCDQERLLIDNHTQNSFVPSVLSLVKELHAVLLWFNFLCHFRECNTTRFSWHGLA